MKNNIRLTSIINEKEEETKYVLAALRRHG